MTYIQYYTCNNNNNNKNLYSHKKYTYRVHIKHLSTNYIKICRIENKLYYNNQNHSITIQHVM